MNKGPCLNMLVEFLTILIYLPIFYMLGVTIILVGLTSFDYLKQILIIFYITLMFLLHFILKKLIFH
mgnify:CR=1 FL=1